MPSSSRTADVLIRVRGTVQGVGYRPFVHRTATQLGLNGWVYNDTQGVLIRAHGQSADVAALVRTLAESPPPAAKVTAVEALTPRQNDRASGQGFVIIASQSGGAIVASTPPDLALCADCHQELLDPANRRYRYPFINCTQCGPRYTLLEQLPYDRPNTTMRSFAMCPQCQQEYTDPTSRRFHAEPNACPICGPQLTLTAATGPLVNTHDNALRAAARLLEQGHILAVQGIGGYHLMCNATHEPIVAALRQRKHRDEKPLAVMFRDLAQLRTQAEISPTAAALLTSSAAPIVLVPKLSGGGTGPTLAASIAPHNPWLGALLPYTPLHVLLLAELDFPLVATSANLSEEPICSTHAEARARLTGIADYFLQHNRPIARPVDDSVLRLTSAAAPILLRRARGYAPAPLTLPQPLAGSLLCVGGQMKSTIAVAAADQVVLSPHLGDLENLATQAVFSHTIATLAQLHRTKFTTIVHDKHPDYASTRYAQRQGLPCLAVQHHLAHVLACLLEHEHPADQVLGVAWDGTGYGEDGTIWGGEFILLRGNSSAERFARLRPFRLVGSAAAVRDARRIALGLAHAIGHFAPMAARFNFSDRDTAIFQTMLSQGLNSPVCSSAGRLFDSFSALLGLGFNNSFEGQLPLALEAAATRAPRAGLTLPFPIIPATTPGAQLDLDWQPAIKQLLQHTLEPTAGAAALHRGLAAAIVNVAQQAGVGTVVLTGGCFQNALLHSLASDALSTAGFRVLVHRQLSPNDNSIAAGQALAALWNLTTVTLPN